MVSCTTGLAGSASDQQHWGNVYQTLPTYYPADSLMNEKRLRTASRLAGPVRSVLRCGFVPQAAADLQDLEPYCDSGQTPTTGECLPRPDSVDIQDAPGADPTVPLGVDPETAPAI